MKAKLDRKPRNKHTHKWSDTPQRPKTSSRKIADPRILPKFKRHNEYDYVDVTRYRSSSKPPNGGAINCNEYIFMYGYVLQRKFTGPKQGWPTSISLFGKKDLESKCDINFDFLLQKGLLYGRYDIRFPARMFEIGTIRPNMLHSNNFILSHIDPKYCVGTTTRGESFNNQCFAFNQSIYPTYSFTIAAPLVKGLNANSPSVYHGIQNAWYYKPRNYHDRPWTLGFNNLPIDEFSVARSQKQIRLRRMYKLDDWVNSQEREDLDGIKDDAEIPIGKGVSYNYTFTDNPERQERTIEWDCVEVVRYFWYGTEINSTEYTRRTLTPILINIFQNVSTSQDIAVLILDYARDDSLGLKEM